LPSVSFAETVGEKGFASAILDETSGGKVQDVVASKRTCHAVDLSQVLGRGLLKGCVVR
jgi:hypothetical protein